MKRLTFNRVAGAGMRANRRAYLSLATGIFLSVFLIAAVALSVQGIALDMRRDVVSKMGNGDALLYDSDLTDQQLQDRGWFESIGHATVVGSIQDGAKYVGFYDETAENLLNRRLLEGRMPEKPGEIAVESTVLDMLALDIHPGDALELNITPIEGIAETRQYTLVGILAEQSGDMSKAQMFRFYDEVRVLDMPALLVCAEDPGFQTGRLAVQRVMTLKKGKSGDRLIDAWDYDDSVLAVISPYYGKLNTGYEYWGSGFVSPQVFCILLLGAALLLVCGIGIAGSLESRLDQRVAQIGMLRAVGATSRQIRRMYGREAWLLALIVSPLALAAACLAVFVASRLLPDALVFKPSPLLLLPVLGFSVIVIVLSASLPLRRVSRIMPMQILRDVKTLRKLRGVKSRKHFNPARLFAMRQGTLHAGRLIGPAALVALTMAVLLFAVELGSQVVSGSASVDFVLSGNTDKSSSAFCDLIPDSVLSSGDIAQIAALPEIGAVHAKRTGAVILEIDRVSDYFKEGEDEDDHVTSPLSYPTDYLLADNGWQDGTDGMAPVKLDYCRFNWALQQRLETDRKLIGLDLVAVDGDASVWRQAVTEGKLDMNAIDRGEQVLAYMPDSYRFVYPDGQVMTAPYPLGSGYRLYRQNDYFHPGQALPLHQLRRTGDDMSARMQARGDSPDDYLRLYDDAQRIDATPSVGAVQTKYMSEFWVPCLVTTEAGARAMGLAVDHIEQVDIWLGGSVDVETEERVFRRVSGIAARGGLTAYNKLKSRRENAQEQRTVVVTFIAVGVVFLGAAVGLISGTIRRRVMADARAIGTLRAVGANERTIRSCYSGQVLLTLLLGGLMGLGLFALYGRFSEYLPAGASPMLIAGTQAAALLAIWGACALMLDRSVRAVTKKSIIENIREL